MAFRMDSFLSIRPVDQYTVVRVIDNGAPSLSITQTFVIVVLAQASKRLLTSPDPFRPLGIDP